MFESLKTLLRRMRAWMAKNERAHRDAKADGCCSSPSAIYAARRPRGKGGKHQA